MTVPLHRRDFLRTSGILDATVALEAPSRASEQLSLQAGVAAVNISPRSLPAVCNGLPFDHRPVTGYLFPRGRLAERALTGDHLKIDGTHEGGLNAGAL